MVSSISRPGIFRSLFRAGTFVNRIVQPNPAELVRHNCVDLVHEADSTFLHCTDRPEISGPYTIYLSHISTP